jgi:hypothetical protein
MEQLWFQRSSLSSFLVATKTGKSFRHKKNFLFVFVSFYCSEQWLYPKTNLEKQEIHVSKNKNAMLSVLNKTSVS